jgi:hypothetical protein
MRLLCNAFSVEHPAALVGVFEPDSLIASPYMSIAAGETTVQPTRIADTRHLIVIFKMD